jgi:hypothetical protein
LSTERYVPEVSTLARGSFPVYPYSTLELIYRATDEVSESTTSHDNERRWRDVQRG